MEKVKLTKPATTGKEGQLAGYCQLRLKLRMCARNNIALKHAVTKGAFVSSSKGWVGLLVNILVNIYFIVNVDIRFQSPLSYGFCECLLGSAEKCVEQEC